MQGLEGKEASQVQSLQGLESQAECPGALVSV